MAETINCPKCNGTMKQVNIKFVDDPVLTKLGGIGIPMGKCVGAIIDYKCSSCGHTEKKTEHYTS